MLVDTAAPAPSEPPPGPSPPGRPPDSAAVIFTLQGAADACGVDPKSIRRRRQQLEDHGSQRNEDGSWSIPLGALLAAGLHPGKPSPPDAPPGQHEVGGRPASPGAAPEAARIAELERLLTEERAARLLEQVQRQAAEQLAAERKAWIADLRLALRAIEAGRPDPAGPGNAVDAALDPGADRPESQPAAEPDPNKFSARPEPPAPARRWWHRRPRPLSVAGRGPS
jgi:hypothetical protein